MGCATASIKYLVFIFNTLCALIGIGTIIVAALSLNRMEDYGKVIAIIIIVLGSIIFIISFFGCFGAIRENVCMTWTYAVFLILLIVGNIVVLSTQMNHIDGDRIANSTINNAWTKVIKGDPKQMDAIQSAYHCCGKQSPKDYLQIGQVIPFSCYYNLEKTNSTNLHSEGCIPAMSTSLEGYEHRVKIFGWISLGVEIGALTCACVLAITFSNQKRRDNF